MKDLRYLNKYLLKYKYHLLLGTVFTIISNGFAILPAQIVRHAFDLIVEMLQWHDLYDGFKPQEKIYTRFAIIIPIYGGAILLMAFMRGVFLFLVRQTLIVMSRLIEYDLKNEIFAHYQTLPLSFYRKNNTGDLMARISEDVSKVRMYLGPGIMYGLNLFTLFLMLIPYMFSINTKLTIYALIPLPLLSISIYFVNNIINKKSEIIQKSLSQLSTFTQEAFSGIRVIKSFAREYESANKFTVASNDYKDKSLKLTFVNALFFPLIMFMIGLSAIITVYVGGVEVIAGDITVGNIAEFIIYVNMLTWPVASLGWISSIIQRADASQRRINEFLRTKTEIISKKDVVKPIKGKITFKHVNFTYPDSGIQALKDVSFEILPGQSFAIIGTTGSGKSSLANLICRMYDVSAGEVSIDDVPIEDYNLTSLRSQIGYVPQDVFLFSDTIYNNIIFGLTDIDKSKVIQATKDAALYDSITSFSNGFNTVLGERGITLSGGQKQRASIARALVRNPQVLILDDCLSAVDTNTENEILNNLKRIMQNRTTVIISHRVSSAKLADKILVLDDGHIIEQGTHESLLDSKGIYFSLYEKQLHMEDKY